MTVSPTILVVLLVLIICNIIGTIGGIVAVLGYRLVTRERAPSYVYWFGFFAAILLGLV